MVLKNSKFIHCSGKAKHVWLQHQNHIRKSSTQISVNKIIIRVHKSKIIIPLLIAIMKRDKAEHYSQHFRALQEERNPSQTSAFPP